MISSPRRATRAGIVGGGLAMLVFTAMLFGGHASLMQTPPSATDFFDVQAHSLLAGHWDVPPGSLGIEGFVVGGKVYEYFGPFPALLRLPIAAFTDRFDGRLGQISMLIAFAIAMTFTLRLWTRIRPLVRGTAPITRGEQWATGAFVFAVGAGSVFTFLASRSWAYHEAELWGAALALGAFESVLAYIVDPTRRRLVLASALITAALLARGSVGAGPLVALGLVFLAGFWTGSRRFAGVADPRATPTGRRALVLAWTVPVALYAYVNHAKFGTFFSLPFNAQVSNKLFEGNRYVLAANHGSMFNLHLVPTGALQYLVPNLPRFSSLFPWVTFGPSTGVVGIHSVLYTWTASYPTTMPLLALLGLVGGIGIARAARPRGSPLAPLRPLVIGAAVATLPTLSYAYLAERYVSDFMPLGILLGATGLHLVLRWSSGCVRSRRRVAAWTVLGALAAVSVWWNVGLGVIYGRLLDGDVKSRDLASFVAFQYDLHHRFPGGSPPAVHQGPALPRPAQQAVFIQGDCDGLYWSDGDVWTQLEGSPATGTFRLRVAFPDRPTGWEPLVTSSPRHGKPQYIAVRTLPGTRVQFAYDGVFPGPPLRLGPGPGHTVEVVMDPHPGRRRGDNVIASVDGRVAYSTSLPNPIIGERIRPLRDVTIGRAATGDSIGRFSGTVTRLPARTPLCDRLRTRA